MAPHPKNSQLINNQQLKSQTPTLNQATIANDGGDKTVKNVQTSPLPANSTYHQQNVLSRGGMPINVGGSYMPGGGMYGGGVYGGGMYGAGYSPFGYGMNMGYGASSGILGTIYSLQHAVALCGQLIHIIGANSNSFALFVENMFRSVKEMQNALITSGMKIL